LKKIEKSFWGINMKRAREKRGKCVRERRKDKR
jgi:hypothetical protein